MRAVVHDPPWLHVMAAGGALPVDLLLPTTGTTYVARVDGREMADLDGVFQIVYCDAGTVPAFREQLESCWAEVTASPS
ncbi:hypothetical protein AB0G42_22255 [Streptomyces yangpuensis]|uniref:hypothetical protein n=1 Tax=Streptomyces yangpuensis TaxID=1648182 RepID=UPI00343C080C